MPNPNVEKARLDVIAARAADRERNQLDFRGPMALEQISDTMLEIRDALRDLRTSADQSLRYLELIARQKQ